ncbi:MAG: hypothetical protein ABIG11_05165 [bacterium]
MPEQLPRYWVYLDKTVLGPFLPKDISRLPGFTAVALVSPENALGQWREAAAEPPLREICATAAARSAHIATDEKDPEGKALTSILEKTLRKNADLEDEICSLRNRCESSISDMAQELKRKEDSIRGLSQELEKAGKCALTPEGHPSWENIYREMKNQLENKLKRMAEQLGAREAELLRIKKQLEKSPDNRNSQEIPDIDLKKQVSDRDTRINCLDSRLASALERSSELQKLISDEKEDFERRMQKISEENGMLMTRLSWKERELEQSAREKTGLALRIKELETGVGSSAPQAKSDLALLRGRLAALRENLESFENLKTGIRDAFAGMSAVMDAQRAEISRLRREDGKGSADAADARNAGAHVSSRLEDIAGEISSIHSSLENLPFDTAS